MKKILVAIAVVALAAMAAPAFAAMNPFMDVPASHWAYDAVAQLAARGVISGYPDGSYKGPNPATRYEIASMIARAVAFIDFEKASKDDVALMRRLMIEFNEELLALGVRVDNLEDRLGTLDKDLGGWKLSGELDFRANFGSTGWGTLGDNDFDIDIYRINFEKRVNDTTTFYARLGRDVPGMNGEPAMGWKYYYVTTNLGYDMLLDVGNFGTSFEHDAGLVADDAAYVGDFNANGFRLRKDWGMANIQLLAARRGDAKGYLDGETWDTLADWVGNGVPWAWEAFWFGAHVDLTINEMFRGGAFAYYQKSDVVEFADSRLDVVGYVHFSFNPSITLSGAYYYQDIADYDETGSAWKVFLNVDQNLLKFTDLRLEYAQIDHDFFLDNNPYTKYGYNAHGGVAGSEPGFPIWLAPIVEGVFGLESGSSRIMGVKANQQWGDTPWSSWLRFYHINFDIDNVDNFNNYGAGINYQFNPNVNFGLGFDYVDGGDFFGSEHVVRFQTVIGF